MKTTIEQRRAADALARVEELKTKSEDFKKLYRSYVSRIGPAIVMNGLGQALATERAAAGSKKTDRERAHNTLYRNLECWLCNQSDGVYGAKNSGSADLLKAIMDNDQPMYLRAQAEALAWLEWHKKFCRAEFPADGNEGSGE